MGYEKEIKLINNNKNNLDTDKKSENNRKWEIVWPSLNFFVIIHLGAVYSIFLINKLKLATIVFQMFYLSMSILSITGGAHRLWAHKTYKARWPLQLLLLFFNTSCGQYTVIHWVRDHRMHHKYSETDADPHNAKRGFFFSHIGWLVMRKHPEVKAKGHTIDISDLRADPILRFQEKHYGILLFLTAIAIPTYIPTLWGETAWNAFYVCAVLRFVLLFNFAASVNSVAHLWGNKPYDKNISPVETKIISFVSFGEGFHNYHHTFPWDYKAGELGMYSLNVTTMFIDFMHKIGLAYDLKTVPTDVIGARKIRSGDGS